ncbi:hypothetical protein EG329_008780 [Mollisiaceae sp. DMI_Dod_QoI]|nr:hypothetical protein EG329_008780 [Helotiales sp. DMI_Dod_QoI]
MADNPWIEERETGRWYVNFENSDGSIVRRYSDELQFNPQNEENRYQVHDERYNNWHMAPIADESNFRRSGPRSGRVNSDRKTRRQLPLTTSSPGYVDYSGECLSDDGVIEEYTNVADPLSNWASVEENLPPRANSVPPDTKEDDRHIYMHIRDAWGREQDAIALLDTGSDDEWISRTLVDKLGYSINTHARKTASCGNNGILQSEGTVSLKWRVQHRLLTTEFNVYDFDDLDVVFGNDFLVKEKLVTWNHSRLLPLVSDTKASSEESNRQAEAKQQQLDGAQKYRERKQRSERRKKEERRRLPAAGDAQEDADRRS